MANELDHSTTDEPLLGAVPALSDETWDGMLDEAFLAPPGAFDHLVDTFDEPAPTGYESDAADDGGLSDDGISSEHMLDPTVFQGEATDAADDEGLIDDDALDEAEHGTEAPHDGDAAEATAAASDGAEHGEAFDGLLDFELPDLPDAVGGLDGALDSVLAPELDVDTGLDFADPAIADEHDSFLAEDAHGALDADPGSELLD